jgi:hypothetical protein
MSSHLSDKHNNHLIIAWALIVIVTNAFYRLDMLYIIAVVDFNSLVNISVLLTSVFPLVLFAYILVHGEQWIALVSMAGILKFVAICNLFIFNILAKKRYILW